MTEFEQVQLLTGAHPALKLCWVGTRKSLRYCYVPVWVKGELLKVPVGQVRRKGEGWTASGTLRTEHGTWRVRDVLTPRGNTLVIDREWRWRGGRLSSVRLGFDVFVPFQKLDFWTIPYISMNGNKGTGTVPAGMTDNGTPWLFREERTTAPGLMTLEAGGLVAGSYTEAGRSEQTLSACSIVPGRSGHTLRTFFPFREAPRSYLGHASWADSSTTEGMYMCGGGAAGFVVDGTAKFRREFFVVLDRAEQQRHGFVRIWESAWRNLRDPLPKCVPVKQTEKRLWRTLDHFWVERGKVRGFRARVDRDGHPYHDFDIGWCCPTAMLAWLGLRRAIRARRPLLADRPVKALEFFVKNAGWQNGVFRGRYDPDDMQWRDRAPNAVSMGGGAYWILKCVELLGETRLFRGCIRTKRWTDFALGFCDLAVRTQRADGALPAYWTPEGKVVGFERAMGVHAARAVLEAHRRTGRKEYLDAAERAAEFYAREMIDREQGYGDCTDIHHATTENDAASVPDFYIDLYRITGTRRYLAKAVRAAEYCLSFMFAYNVYFPPETECGRRKMRTRGLAAISPETAFVCWVFLLQANAFLELWKETGERRWKDYAVANVRSSLQMRTEPGDTFGLAGHLVDLRSEVIPVLDTVKDRRIWTKGMTGYTWDPPVWWPAAFNLLTFALIEDRFPEVSKLIGP